MKRKPNVIYVLVDDMGYGDFSAFNPSGDIHTPALDRMVREGVTLSRCYSASPVCAPARAAILTGRYPQRTGAIDTLEVRGLDRLKTSETTMADIFRANGYHTALIGKWHLGAMASEYHPNARGFEYFFGFRGGWNDYYKYNVERNGIHIEPDGTYLTDLLSDDAVNYVKEHAAEPFFLHLTYNAPHFPLQAPEDVIEKYRALGKYNSAVCKLYAMIEIMDRGFGRLLDCLDEVGIADDTIVVFASDNGPDFGGKGDDCQVRYNCELHGEKMLVYEGGIRVPAVVRFPGTIPSETLSEEVVHGTDWLPTLLSMCDIAVPEKLSIDGMDVSGALCGGKLEPRTLCWQWNRYSPQLNGNAAIRVGDRKLLHVPIMQHLDLPTWETDMDVEIKYHPERYTGVPDVDYPPLADEPCRMELYDLKNDPLERNDLLEANPEEAAALDSKLTAWFEEVERERLS